MHRHLVRSTFVFAAVLAVLALGGTPAAAKATAFADAYDGTTTDASCGFAVQVHDVGKVLGRLFFDADGAFVGVDVANSGVVTDTNLDNGLSVTGTYQVLFKNFNQVQPSRQRGRDALTRPNHGRGDDAARPERRGAAAELRPGHGPPRHQPRGDVRGRLPRLT